MFKKNINKLLLLKNKSFHIFLLSAFLICVISLPLFSQSAAPKVISPTGGDKLESGRPYKIEWANIRGSKVNINLIGRGGISSKIARDVKNTGSFLWNVSCSLKGEGFIIWVMSTTANSRARCDNFEIVNPRQIIAPKKGDNVKSGSKFTIKWTGFDCKNVWITLSLSQKYKNRTAHLTFSTRNKGSFIWEVPRNYKGADFQLFVRDVFKQSCVAISDYFYINPFTVKKSLKTLISTKTYISKEQKTLTQKATLSTTTKRAKLLMRPRGKEILKAGSPYEIKWTGLLGGPNVRIILIKNKKFQANLALDAKNTGSFIWNIGPNEQGSNYQIRVTGYPKNTKDYVISQPFTIILPARVTKPNRYFTVRSGEKFMINWRNFTSKTLIIELWQGKSFKQTITRSAPNTNNYEWPVASHYNGYGFKIKIKSSTKSDEVAFSESFKIL